jgi:Tfp pilus assembly protein PilN
VQMTQTAKGIYDARVYWSTILEQVSLVIPENVRLTSMTCTVPPEMLPGAAATGTTTAAVANVTFVGTTYTHKDVAEFMTRLGLIPQLKNIQLSASTGSTTTTTTGTSASPAPVTVTFTVTASLRPYLTAPPTTTLQEGVAQ